LSISRKKVQLGNKRVSRETKIRDAIILMLVGIGLVVVSIIAYQRAGVEAEFARNGLNSWLEAEATVTSVEITSESYDTLKNRNDKHDYRVVSSYTIRFDTPDGYADYTGTLEAGGDTYEGAIPDTAYPSFREGDILPVTYNPANYDDLYFNQTRDQVRESLLNPMQFGMPIIFGILGAVLLVGCFIWLIKLIRNRREPQTEEALPPEDN
jgi:hypothetical protein